MKQKKTTSHYVSVLIRQARRLNLDVERIIEEANIPQSIVDRDDVWVPIDYFTDLMKILWRETEDETIGYIVTPSRLGSWSLICDYALAANTLIELYRRCERILSYLMPEMPQLSVQEEGDFVHITLSSELGERDPEYFLLEFLAAVWHRFPSWAIDENIHLQRADFNYPMPEHGRFYEELFQCAVHFDQPRSGFSFSKKYLNKPISRSLHELSEWLDDSPCNLMYLHGRDNSVQAHIKLQLKEELKANMRFPAFETVCENQAMSPQVVRRRLAEEGSSYQKLKDAIRHDLAIELLSHAHIPITDIAIQTGFTEAAAFSRAFKKWTGMPPADYRAKGPDSKA